MNQKRLVTFILIFATVLIGGAAVYIGYRLSQQSTAPEEIEAETCDYASDSFNCYCTEDSSGKCCDGAWPYNTCGSGWCSNVSCTFRGINQYLNICDLGQMAVCDFSNDNDGPEDGVSCSSETDDCSCSCDDNIPDPPAGYELEHHGTNPEPCDGNPTTTRYAGNCTDCNNPYFCIACYAPVPTTGTPTPPVTTPPVTTPPVTTIVVTTPPVTTIVVTTPPVTTPPTTVTTTPPRTTTPSTPVTTTPRTTVPPTALVTDEIDRIIIGFMLIFVGMLFYRSGLYISLGNIYWNNGGRRLWGSMVNINDAFDGSVKNLWNGLVLFDDSVEGSINHVIYGILNFFIRILNAVIYGFAYVVNTIYRVWHKITTAIEVKVLESILRIRVFISRTRLTLSSLIKFPGKLIMRKTSRRGRKVEFEGRVIRDRKDQDSE